MLRLPQLDPWSAGTAPSLTEKFMGYNTTNITGVAIDLDQFEDLYEQLAESPLQPLSSGRKCAWEGCRSKAVFKSHYSLNQHVLNAHRQPLVCRVADCSHKTPFSRKSYLRRHEQVVHGSAREFICSVASCDARIKEFTRKDHLTKHMRDLHDNYFCNLNHCAHQARRPFAKAEDLAKHLDEEHSDFECALKGCAAGLTSKFTRAMLKRHLRNHHDLFSVAASDTVNRVLNEATKTVTAEHLQRRVSSKECKMCQSSSGSVF